MSGDTIGYVFIIITLLRKSRCIQRLEKSIGVHLAESRLIIGANTL